VSYQKSDYFSINFKLKVKSAGIAHILWWDSFKDCVCVFNKTPTHMLLTEQGSENYSLQGQGWSAIYSCFHIT
jgi:hypothetical protein